MKILVLSDSHSGRSFMRYCIEKIKPDHVIHLGDHYEDGSVMAQEYTHIRFHQVPGNCDRFRMEWPAPDILCYGIGGVRFYMTHGHKHHVKTDIYPVIAAACAEGAQVAVFGHTHQAVCFYANEEQLWVLNPGTCGSWGGSAGVVEIEGEKVSACYIVKQADLD